MSPALEVARELLARTRNIGACLDSMVRPHQRVIDLRTELSKEPFAELGRVRQALEMDLASIEGLLARGLVNEACSALSHYEGRVGLMLPSLRRLAGMKRGSRATGMGSRELEDIEERILAHDMYGAESAMSAFCSAAAPCPTGETSSGAAADCALCGRPIKGDRDLCPYCGWDTRTPAGECPECGGIVLLTFRSCPSCGKKLPARVRENNTVLSSLMIG